MSSWDQAKRGENSLVWRNRKKISQIISDLPLFILIILWAQARDIRLQAFYAIQACTDSDLGTWPKKILMA
jgi:hypothetical protein